MLKLEHITIHDHKGHLLLKDVSLQLPNFGMIALHGENMAMHHALAQILAGIQTPDTGSLFYNDIEITKFEEEERSHYRSTFVSSLFHDFQILKTRSVYENITMGLEYPLERVEQELKKWKLYEKRNILAEDLNTQEQWSMVLMRCILRQPMMLVFDVESCPLSSMECKSFYALLQEVRNRMLVVVIGDQGCYPFATRIIEFKDGYLLSDSIQGEETLYPQINQSFEPFELTRANVEDLHTTIHSFVRWKLRCASILCVAAFIALSTAIFSTTLNITDIQMRLMKKQGSTMIAIEKQAMDNDGAVIENYYDHLDEEDVSTLSKELQGDLILGYYPSDVTLAKYEAYGMVLNHDVTSLDDDTIIEADSESELGIQNLYGNYPQTYYQVALSSSHAYELLKEQLQEPYRNTQEQNEQMVGMRVRWYGTYMTISGIFPSQNDGNRNLDLDMTGYNGSSSAGTMMEHSFFVRKGFHDAYPLLQEKVFRKSYKRMVAGSKIIAAMDSIYPLTNNIYYYDGSEYHMDYDLKEDEILADFAMALTMGYLSNYEVKQTQDTLSYDELQTSYEEFAKSWVGKEVSLQAYTVDNAPNSSSFMSKKVKIKGFLFPYLSSMEDVGVFADEGGTLYVHPSLSAPYESSNIYIEEAFTHSEKESELQHNLAYLNNQSEYAAYLTNSRILKFFVVDLKEITTFLFIFGGISFLVFFFILCFLLVESTKYMRSECTIFYLFGERRSTLKKMIMQYFHMILWMRSLFGWLCGSLALGTFILMIYFALSASSTILLSLILPFLLLLVVVLSVRIIFYIIMRKSKVIEEEFQDR